MLGDDLWMYGGYAWLTNAVAPTTRVPAHADARRHGRLPGHRAGHPGGVRRQPAGCSGSATSWSTPSTVDCSSWPVAPGAARAMRPAGPAQPDSAPPWSWSAGSCRAAGGTGCGSRRCWSMLASPYLNPIGEFTISPAHFVERHGLLIIIALGESHHRDRRRRGRARARPAASCSSPCSGSRSSYLMWWVYFGGDQERGRARAWPRSTRGRRARVALARLRLGALRPAARHRRRWRPASRRPSGTPSTT